VQVPKPLLILVIVVIILAVIGLGASLFAFPDNGPGDDQDEAKGNLTDFLDRVFPKPEPVILRSPGASIDPNDCLSGTQLNITLNQSCVVDIAGSGSLRRELVLQVRAGNVLFRVKQSSQPGPEAGQTPAPDPTQVVPFRKDGQDVNSVSVVLSRDETATVFMDCVPVGPFPSNCAVAVNPD
jgi:hypothetical protein